MSDNTNDGLRGNIPPMTTPGAAREAQFRTLVENVQEYGLVFLDGEGTVISWNRGAAALTGYAAEEAVGRSISFLHAEEELKQDLPRLHLALASRAGSFETHGTRLRKDGTTFWAAIITTALRDEKGQRSGFAVLLRDVTERRLAEEAFREAQHELEQKVAERTAALLQANQRLETANGELRESEHRLELALDAAAMASWDWDPGTGEMVCSAGMQRLLGLSPEARRITWETLAERAHPDDREALKLDLDRALRTRGDCEVEFRLQRAARAAGPRGASPPGDDRWLSLKGRAIAAAGARRARMIGVASDVTERRQYEERLARHAFRDPVTGLANRALFMDRLEQTLRALPRRGGLAAVMFLDLDRFKLLNDARGHAAGDELLRQVGQRLQACLRPRDTVARFGGDEFTVLLEDLSDPLAMEEVAERLMAHLAEPFIIGAREVIITASIGVALARSRRSSPEELLREADVALYRAKALGKARWIVFDETMSAAVAHRLDLETDLHKALFRGEVCIHYQPEIDLDTRSIVGMEALVRWQHPTRGLLHPGEFLTVAEETGAIEGIGYWLRREVCRQSAVWNARSRRSTPLVMGINLSVREFLRPDFPDEMRRLVDEFSLPPGALRVEITERTVMDDADAAVVAMEALRRLGIAVAIDDFGTGYSCLGYLRRLKVDVLKIDRAFVQELDGDETSRAIMRAIIQLADSLGIQLTAEGIETREQQREVRSAGCLRGQGFYFFRPMDAETLTALLA